MDGIQNYVDIYATSVVVCVYFTFYSSILCGIDVDVTYVFLLLYVSCDISLV